MGGILLSDRAVVGLDCILCKSITGETLDHFLVVCAVLSYIDMSAFPWIPAWVKDDNLRLSFSRISWLLSLDRSVSE